jgi:hypothetical protein
MPGGAISEQALVYEKTSPGLQFDGTVTVKARTWRSSLFNNGMWSPLTEATFHIGRRPVPGDLVISEIHYRPGSPSEEETAAGFDARSAFEFIEVYNKSGSTVSLIDVAFTTGFQFAFREAMITELAPGQAVVLVQNRDAFELRYGDGLPVAGSFDSFKLDDSGETLRLSLNDGVVLQELEYDDKGAWPAAADGDGPSLTLIDPDSMDGGDASHWKESAQRDGTPGRLESDAPNTIDQDGDGLPAFLEEALGSSDTDAASGPSNIVLAQELVDIDGTTAPYWTFETSRNPTANGYTFDLEVSTDMVTWESASLHFVEWESAGGSGASVKWRSRNPVQLLEPGSLFLRLRVSQG